MIVELNIRKNGYVTCLINNNNFSKYYNFNDISAFILREKKYIKNVKIENGDMFILTEDLEIIINNYCFNKDPKLSIMINSAIKIKVQQRYENLKKQKIQRTNAFIGSVIVTIGILASSVFANSEKKQEKNIESESSLEEIINQDEYTKDKISEVVEVKKIGIEEINDLENNLLNENINEFKINFDDRTNTDKFIKTKNNYYDKVKAISLEYGIDPQIMLAIATQESGKHIINDTSPAIGLMQIEKNVWDNEKITAYNYIKNNEETLLITKEKLKDLDFNIRVACMYFQNCLINSNDNLLVALQMYNFGYGNINKVLKKYYNENEINLKDAINNLEDDWLFYREYIDVGDKKYIEHVLSYVENLDRIEFNINNEKHIFKINNNIKKL